MLGGLGLKSIGLGWISKTALFLAEIPSNAKRIFNNDNLLEDRFPSLDGFNGTPNSQESFLLLSSFLYELLLKVLPLTD